MRFVRGYHHQRLMGSTAGPSGRYLEELCRAICVGLTREMKHHLQHLKKPIDHERSRDVTEGAGETEESSIVQEWDDVIRRGARWQTSHQSR